MQLRKQQKEPPAGKEEPSAMTSEQIDHACWQMAFELLRGLETRDLQIIAKLVKPLQQALAVRHCLADSVCAGRPLACVEQLDLLEGITESVEASVEAIRRSAQPHVMRMQTAESLLRHLVDQQDGVPSRLPVC